MEPNLPNIEFLQGLRRALKFGQVNRNLLKFGVGADFAGNGPCPASEMFVENFKRAIDSGLITNAELANPSLITNIDTSAPADSFFVLECVRAGAFGQLTNIIPDGGSGNGGGIGGGGV